MRPKSLVLLALALGCGLVASIGISQVLDSKGKSAKVETVPIYVALHNINLGDAVDDTMVSLEEWPKDKVPVGAITKWEDLEERRPRATIFEGEPVLDSKLLAKGQINDPIKAIPPNMRLKTISVDARKSAAGLLSPGNRVDLQLFVRRNEREGFTQPFSKIFLQNIRVFAVDATVERMSDGEEARTVAKTVSLIVTPEQANRINLAENLGEISLIPRGEDDEKIVEEFELNPEELLARGSANSRQKERGSTAPRPEPSAIGLQSMLGAMARNRPEPADEFEMTIIYPNEVSRVQFVNGRPILEDASAGGTNSAPNSLVAPNPVGVAGDGDEAPEDFPIDLRVRPGVLPKR